jgi:hypothetical protein
MFVKVEGGYINLDLVHSIDVADDGAATLWFVGTEYANRDVTADDMKAIEAAIRPECAAEEIESPAVATHSVVDACKAAGLPIVPVDKEGQ